MRRGLGTSEMICALVITMALLMPAFGQDTSADSPDPEDTDTEAAVKPGMVRGSGMAQSFSDIGQPTLNTQPMQGGQNNPQTQPQQIPILESPINGPAEVAEGPISEFADSVSSMNFTEIMSIFGMGRMFRRGKS
eukprot:6723409-Pyramimonas_sp.AAC.1